MLTYIPNILCLIFAIFGLFGGGCGLSIEPLKNMTVIQGKDITLRCIIKGGEEGNKRTWTRKTSILYVGSAKLEADENIKLITDEKNEYSIEISTVNPSYEGEYTCAVYGDNTAKSSMYLTVNVAPVLSEVSKDRIVDEGEEVFLKCLAEGKPQPKISWRHLVPSADGVRGTSEFLPLGKVVRGSAGTYECTADNGVSSPVVKAIRLTVNYPPQLDDENRVQTSVINSATSLQCVANSEPQSNFEWYQPNGEIVSILDNYRVVNMKQEGKYMESTLFISSTKQKDFGNFTCVASNNRGSTNQTVQLIKSVLPPTRLPPNIVFGRNGNNNGGGGSPNMKPQLVLFSIFTIVACLVVL